MSDEAKLTQTKIGRPEKEFTEEELRDAETFGKIKAPYDLMASHFRCSERTVYRWMEDEDSSFRQAYKKGFSQARNCLAQAQYTTAVDKGNVTMQIWLGKQWLGQADKQEFKGELTFPNGVLEIVRPKDKGDAGSSSDAG